MSEPPTTTGALARLGFSRTDRVQRFLAEPALEGLGEGGAEAIGATADGDDAVLGLLRLAEAAQSGGHDALLQEFLSSVGEDGSPGHRLITLLGTSVALGDFLARHPEQLEALRSDQDALTVPASQVREDLLRAVGADPDADVPVAGATGREARDALRVAYHARLLQIAAADVSAEDPTEVQPAVSQSLSDLADAALDAGAAASRAAVDDHERVRWTVIAMGKTGARELNYISDVDVMHVVAPAAGDTDAAVNEDELVRTGSALARELARVCSDRTAEGTLWQVDANLRPEGKDGPLVRTLDSYRRYYDKWADSWEFQALLKARPAAGDQELGRDFAGMVAPWVWKASRREGFVEDTRAMRRRVVAHIPRSEAERNIKLGPGGLRDVEFTVQLLQMVHGRTDEDIHARSTLEALARLGEGGYISRSHVTELDEAYRFLRSVEHRMQLHRLRRTQVMPTSDADRRRLARTMRLTPGEFHRRYEATRRRVRQLHEEIFYRPLLVTASQLSDGQIRLSPEDAQARLAAIGYRDPGRALGHIEALTQGISRRASIQRQLLPAMLEWFADGIDPDMGLLAFRRLSDEIGSAHWYLGLLRDSGLAAKRLTRVLAGSRFVGQQLEQVPEAVRWLARDEDLRPLERDVLGREFLAVITRVESVEAAQDLLRRTRRRELMRIALAHLVGLIRPEQVAAALTDLAEAALEAGLLVAYHAVAKERSVIGESTDPLDLEGDPGGEGAVDEGTAHELRERRSDPARALGVEMAILALGSFGAREMGYSSDADVQFIAVDRGAGKDTGQIAVAIATQVQHILNAPAAGADMKVNADLRPEGRNGLLARSLEAWTEYYRRDALTWEKQALLRARPVVASEELAERIQAELDHHRYPADGLSPTARREISRMKARIESERLPRGADPSRHVKLGRGGMTDVEWTAQVLTLEHAAEHPGLRTTTTLEALRAASEAGVLSEREVRELADAWTLAWQVRRGLFLWKGREGAVLPSDRIELRALARLIDGDDGSASELEERYLRQTRRARHIVERVVFGL
ncbi:bifunctional [glutamine synthetase] adenylyltransferase/[glutamine synthetase]-adenylyl-L-tyrosine phosphorylase [Brachybacterium muris]|uniref:bifunctional [glutamine synthetase] adenylyltransferase/[glutamine synthetase]-adenylyl-L-tyrosine phosphorylase n=1 Tax=Brachybacterium muris TaxID=219301 RepID=UPI001958F70A|nr:bifunctional [glutamine synthetase] adenylyltransferase/[glutamine synthetase]-adenylyl-L-tyrosine phosphorylase [Brachybacterium muris]MBM7500762.1 glutamate-ammonia-ligase adenylyltransferase [Brachybacterium muris]MCT1430240.1 bifunctional [glutamine synthetase] adenylyltransferase/[glutamine synthetase]-adenylyl-L-tyrosine phosphorylase [Brachybacterium muris]MCT1654049.1 bifunctional [glutamine synthetase] adenylyltransferase/[glutamine synthetase]-adenylyl-L-tyrosine phosphorylase [Brac